jgi:DNA polymerase III subunit delta
MPEGDWPVILLHGEDEFAIAQFLIQFESGLGDRSLVEMNTTRLDGGTTSLEQLFSTAGALPFLAPRRLVIFTHPLSRVKDKASQKKFTDLLERIPPTTALVLIHSEILAATTKGKSHWLLDWAAVHGERVQVKAFPLPKGPELARRIQALAKEQGGQINAEAAELLSALVDGDLRLASQEIPKLLAYVNYKRPIEFDDVQSLTADVGEGDIFAMVDALSARDARRSFDLLERLLEYQDYYSIFGMIVRQFRLLLLAREALDRGAQLPEVMASLRTGSKYVAEKTLGQARRFSLPELELAYRRLLQIDETVKTSLSPDRLALETFVAGFTTTGR